MLDYRLKQSGRASLDFLSSFGAVVPALSRKQTEALKAKGLTDDAKLANDMDERAGQIEGALEPEIAYRVSNLIGEWHAEHHGRIAKEAFEQIAPELRPDFEKYAKGATTLTPNPDIEVPKYWRYPVHRTTGGWDGHPDMGFIHGELVHRYIVGKSPKPPAAGNLPTDIYSDRRNFAGRAPRRDYGKILEIGCSSGPYTEALAQVFPSAEVWACDISIAQLEQAQRNGNHDGRAWKLFQADGQNTGQPDASFDLVTSYIILHELPVEVIVNILKESFRVLKPGGDLLFGDVAPYAAISKVDAWRTDYMAKFGGEPFWRGSSTMDMIGEMKKIGFVDVKYEGTPPTKYPWMTYGRKP
ncbi:MAG: class I SAM-dependent methyltransferase [Alphaproteobacteria bacterium]|nr:class I SAM-dependent methyltransferase [Alphaproteobacteria bacterium]